MQTFILLNWYDWKRQKIRTPRDVSLELKENRLLSLEMVDDILTRHLNLFIFIADPQRANHAMFSLLNCEWCSKWHYEIYIIEFFPAANDSSDIPLIMKFLESVVWLALSYRIKVDFVAWHGTFSLVLLS